MLELKDKIIGSYIGTAIGDAFGLPWEFANSVDEEKIKKRASRNSPWGYSDDTEMMIGIAESLISHYDFNPKVALQSMAKNYEPARGYGKGMKFVFRHIANGLPWQKAAYTAWEEGSKGNGSSVRIAPIACRFYNDKALLIEKAKLSSITTHAHELAINGAIIQALTIAYLIQQDPNKELQIDLLIKYLLKESHLLTSVYIEKLHIIETEINNQPIEYFVSKLGNGVLAEEAVLMALVIFLKNHNSFVQTIFDAVKIGGDTDTISALAGSLSGAYLGINGIPIDWQNNLESHGKGYEYIYNLALNLYQTMSNTN